MKPTHDDWVPGAVFDHKLAQLCRQVEDAVSLGLYSSRDPVLRDLCVIDVTPVRGAAVLLVRVTSDGSCALADIEAALDHARGYLRSEAAESIYRKRAPELVFEVVPAELAFC